MSLYDTRAIDKVKVVMMKGETGGGGGGASALTELSDVDISYPYDGQSLIYDSNNQKWVNGNAYTAGAGIILNNKQFRNAYRNARLGKIDTISSGYAHTEIDMQTSESVGSGSVVILKSEVSGTANTLRIQKSSTPSDVLDRPFYEWDGTATSVNITAGDLLIITFDMTTGYRAQVLDIIPESSGGGDTSQVKYQIVTKSTGGNDASITVKKYVDGTLKTSTDYLYSVLEGGVTIDGLISLEYGTIPLSYTYTLLQASTTHSAGYAYSWGYNQTVDFEDTFIVENVVHSLAGMGKEVSYSNQIITTDIELFRAPKVGDRFLIYFPDSCSNPRSLVINVNGVATTLSWEIIGGDTYKGLCAIEVKAGMLSAMTLKKVWQEDELSAGTGISISNNTITNTAPQLGENVGDRTYTTAITDGDLGNVTLSDDYVILNFKASAQPNSSTGKYFIQEAASSYHLYAALVDMAGNDYTDDIPAGTTLICKNKDGGDGTSADPYLVTVLGIGSGGGSAMSKTRYTIAAASWSATQDASGYYTYSVSLTTALNTTFSPNIYITGASDSVFPTSTEESQFDLLENYCNLASSSSLTLYATTKPTSDFYIKVEGVNS